MVTYKWVVCCYVWGRETFFLNEWLRLVHLTRSIMTLCGLKMATFKCGCLKRMATYVMFRTTWNRVWVLLSCPFCGHLNVEYDISRPRLYYTSKGFDFLFSLGKCTWLFTKEINYKTTCISHRFLYSIYEKTKAKTKTK